MNDKIKFPLSTLFGFIIGAVVFYPLGSMKIETEQQASAVESIVAVTPDSINIVEKKSLKVLKVTAVKYKFTKKAITQSNLAIQAQLNSERDVIVLVRDDRQSNNTVTLDKSIKDKQKVIKKRIFVKKVNYIFLKGALKISNQAIKLQLYDATDANQNIDQNAELAIEDETTDNINDVAINQQNKIDNVDLEIAEFSAGIGSTENNADKDSNIAVPNSDNELQTDTSLHKSNAEKININEFEIAEVSESNLLNTENNNESKIITIKKKRKFKKIVFKKIKLSKKEILLSNLAIKKQLGSYSLYNKKTRSYSSGANSDLNFSNEADLLISNSDYEYNTDNYGSNSKASINSNIANIENYIEYEEDEGDEDEYGSERIVFSEQPHYFVDSFEEKLDSSVENVTDLDSTESFEIEEIEFNDDDGIVTSATDVKIKN